MNENLVYCSYCGSRNFRADRSLAGRMVCRNCGNPYSPRNHLRSVFIGENKYVKYFILFIFIFSFILLLSKF